VRVRRRLINSLPSSPPPTAGEAPGRVPVINGLGIERTFGRRDLLPMACLLLGLRAARPVCRLKIRNLSGMHVSWGTGFLVSPSLLLTNNHVFIDPRYDGPPVDASPDHAIHSLAEFDAEDDENFRPRVSRTFRLDPDRFFFVDKDLDFALVAIHPRAQDGTALADYGFHTIIEPSGKVLVNEAVTLIQHPGGSQKYLVLRDNNALGFVEDKFVHYSSDTERGSSGCPVFKDQWQVAALHRTAMACRNEAEQPLTRTGAIWEPSMTACPLRSNLLRSRRPKRATQVTSESSEAAPVSLEAGPPGVENRRGLGIVEGLRPGGGTLHDRLRGGRAGGSPVETPAERNDSRPAPSPREGVPPGSSSPLVKAMSEVTRILSAIDQGDPSAAEQLLPLVYDELRKLAAQRLAHETPGQTLQATALVHEAYLRLVDVEKVQHWNSRRHFFAAAAEAMRRILVEQARRKSRHKHGGGRQRIPMDEAEPAGRDDAAELLAIHDALDRLAADDPDAAQLVHLRYFGGLSVEQAAETMGLPRSTAYAHWAYARASLRVLLDFDPYDPPS
jgi:RNA polymerase sigma factor (TIGR02999 family)